MATEEKTPAVVLEDGQGGVYAVPVDLIEKCQVPDEDVESVRNAAKQTEEGDDNEEVSGYWWWNWGVSSRPVYVHRPTYTPPPRIWGGAGMVAAGGKNFR